MEFSGPATESSGSVDGRLNESRLCPYLFGEGGVRGLGLEEGIASGLGKIELFLWASSLGKIKCLGPGPWALGRLLSDKTEINDLKNTRALGWEVGAPPTCNPKQSSRAQAWARICWCQVFPKALFICEPRSWFVCM